MRDSLTGRTAVDGQDPECALSPTELTTVAHRSSRAVSVVCVLCVRQKDVRQAINHRSACFLSLRVNHLHLTVALADLMRIVLRWRLHCVGCEQQ